VRQLVVLSGKGGTGKTVVAAALAARAVAGHRLVLVDADVDAANLGLLLDPEHGERQPFVGGQVAQIDPDRCLCCGLCAEVCRFDAIENGLAPRIDPTACEGCRACLPVCLDGAIRMVPEPSGWWARSTTRLGPLFHAELGPARDNSGKLVSQVRQAAREWWRDHATDLVLIDGPPGIGCPAIAAATGVDLALLVTEPSVSGVHDLARVAGMLQGLGVAAAVCLNRADLCPAAARDTEALCARLGLPLIGRIPFDAAVPRAVQAGEVLERGARGPAADAIDTLWDVVERLLASRAGRGRGDGRPPPGGARTHASRRAAMLPTTPNRLAVHRLDH
jgi:MinD superfamily P-loop ATPase